ncbi:Dph3p [Malassezia vespertilionis]|uniref:Diphthamide biosynthesis protein 3 n=1 Tax=Malassezia vespertilionis TaxID=2020962 RepID=A0A2N1JB37_9BASI|nr:Dph3p [Malassezia vespertilionis]
MSKTFYDEIELEDMEFDEVNQVFHYPCPCGDRFEITPLQLKNEEDIGRCPSCTLMIRIIFDPLDFTDIDDAPHATTQVAAAA